MSQSPQDGALLLLKIKNTAWENRQHQYSKDAELPKLLTEEAKPPRLSPRVYHLLGLGDGGIVFSSGVTIVRGIVFFQWCDHWWLAYVPVNSPNF